jgi:hypothetical protein
MDMAKSPGGETQTALRAAVAVPVCVAPPRKANSPQEVRMSVVSYPTDYFPKAKGNRCTACGEPLTYPFVHWGCVVYLSDGDETTESLFFCSTCCQGTGIRRGLFDDMKRCSDIKAAQMVVRDPAHLAS